MPYIVELKLRDTRKEFATEAERDSAYTAMLAALSRIGVPDNKRIVNKIDTQLSEFTRQMEEKIVGGVGE